MGIVQTPLVQIFIALIVVGVLLWLVNNFIPMAGSIKSILNAVVIIIVVVWLLNILWPHGITSPIFTSIAQGEGGLSRGGSVIRGWRMTGSLRPSGASYESAQRMNVYHLRPSTYS